MCERGDRGTPGIVSRVVDLDRDRSGDPSGAPEDRSGEPGPEASPDFHVDGITELRIASLLAFTSDVAIGREVFEWAVANHDFQETTLWEVGNEKGRAFCWLDVPPGDERLDALLLQFEQHPGKWEIHLTHP